MHKKAQKDTKGHKKAQKSTKRQKRQKRYKKHKKHKNATKQKHKTQISKQKLKMRLKNVWVGKSNLFTYLRFYVFLCAWRKESIK